LARHAGCADDGFVAARLSAIRMLKRRIGGHGVKALQRVLLALAASCLVPLAACGNEPVTPSNAPPRASDAITLPNDPSHVEIDLVADLAELERTLEQEIPRQLWAIDQPGSTCVASKKIDLELFRVKSPKIKCRIVGKVTRGRLKLSGRGPDLLITMPITGVVAARDVAGILKGETGTGAANVTLRLRLDLKPDWTLTSATEITYDWTKEPGIDFLGRRITFTSKADDKLAKVRRDVKAIIARELARLPIRAAAEEGWAKSHAVMLLNRENPEVWARITPQRFLYGGYDVRGRALTLRLGLDGTLQTFVGLKPTQAAPDALPPLAVRSSTTQPSVLRVPVIADYAVLEPVLEKALTKRAARPFVIANFGSVIAEFSEITVYGTPKGRIAVGAQFKAKSDLPMIEAASGQIWLTARPMNEPNSRRVRFADIAVSGDTNLSTQPMLLALANAPEFQAIISDALRQNFENDFAKLTAKINRAVARRRDGPVDYAITIENIATGTITAHGEGLYLPVELTARGQARLVRVK
jgi:hypothetical protein